MEVHFYVRYTTAFSESCHIQINDGPWQPLQYLNDRFWQGRFPIDAKKTPMPSYRYGVSRADGSMEVEWETERTLPLGSTDAKLVVTTDFWNPMSAIENTFFTQPFTKIFSPPAAESPEKKSKKAFTHCFRVKSPMIGADEAVCLLGHGKALRNWDFAAPILLERRGNWWECQVDLSDEDFPLAYKYGVWDKKNNIFKGFESGDNRSLYAMSTQAGSRYFLHDGFTRFPVPNWRGAGVAIPVFSLRTEQSWGVGEFADMMPLADWSQQVGLRLIQLLPINDTTATRTWVDSYPYAAISAFALHPIFLNVEQLAGKKHAALLKPHQKKRKALNALEAVDYEGVLSMKWEIFTALYEVLKADWQEDAAYKSYLSENKHWLLPYAAFCYLRDLNGTPDSSRWAQYQQYEAKAIEKLFDPKAKNHDSLAIHLFVQWHLHLQLKAATDYAHQKGLAVKGDIPIGIYRYSCDAWVAPELYNMDRQAGAPPDDFAANGQNWGFPTYNWARMKQDGFAWWKQRFEQMSLYFDAFRIDHILGFFRIWSIPLDAVQGILGQFVPAIPITERELWEPNIGFNRDRLCKPYVTEQALWDIFGENAPFVAEKFLKVSQKNLFDFLPEYDTQQKVERFFAAQEPTEGNALLRDGLYELLANVVLLEGQGGYHFRFGIEKTRSFQALPGEVQTRLQDLYVNYFFRRQDDFWQREAMDKLPDLKRSTNMLICGEDLGMVPHCVPDVMNALRMLSLEIQRMPKAAGSAFFHPKDAPYLSVVTPSTHDMSTLRGWWEEDANLTQRFYNEVLQEHGTAPTFCEAWVNKKLLEQHFYSPAMWSIFQLQDLLGMDAALRRKNPNDERINLPSNPKHYWRYRMHLSIEDLIGQKAFNTELQNMVIGSGRGMID